MKVSPQHLQHVRLHPAISHGGLADFKNDKNQSDLFDNRLQTKVIKVVDVSYGGENGFNQTAAEISTVVSGWRRRFTDLTTCQTTASIRLGE